MSTCILKAGWGRQCEQDGIGGMHIDGNSLTESKVGMKEM